MPSGLSTAGRGNDWFNGGVMEKFIVAVLAVVAFASCLSAEDGKAPAKTQAAAKQKASVSQSAPAEQGNLGKLTDPDPIVRRNAVIYIGAEKKKANVPRLIKMLADENVEVRRAAINALGASGDPRAVSALLEKFTTEKNLNAKMSIIMAIGDTKSARAVPLMKTLLKDPYPAIRGEAVRALGKINAAETHKDIAAMLSDEAEGVRVMAAQISGLLKIKTAVPLLVKNLADPIAVVRRSCAQALGRLGDASSIAELEKLLNDADKAVSGTARSAIENINRELEEIKALEQSKPAKGK